MGTLTFSFKPVVKTKKSTAPKKQSEYSIIDKKVIGLCCIGLDGIYYVLTHHGNLSFTKESYHLKTKRLYSQQLIDKKLLLYIYSDNLSAYSKECFLPFAPSIYLRGNIIKHNITGKLYFDLICTLNTIKTDGSKEQFLFYKNNYDTIHKNFICNLNFQLQ